MLVGVDANISRRLVAALNELYSNAEFQPVGVGPAESDAPWLRAFAEQGGQAVIGLDRRILSKPFEVAALQASQLNACFLDFRQQQRLAFQAATLIYIWPKLERLWTNVEGNAIYRYTPSTRLDDGRLDRLEFVQDNGVPRVKTSKTDFM